MSGVFPQSGRPISPIAIEGTFGAFDFGMAFDFGVNVVDEGKVTIGEFDGVFAGRSLPVAAINPMPPFSGMSKRSPFSQFPE